MLERFQFTVEPMIFAGTHGGTEKLLKISVEVNGKSYAVSKVMSGHHEPWETELEYCANRAVRTLEDRLRQAAEDGEFAA